MALAVVEEAYGADLSRLPQHTTWQSTAALLLTRRSSRLKNHPGQWALPGGRLDPGETPEQAALREMQEEVGLAVSPSAILGRLDDYETRSGFVITPIVVWVGSADAASPNPDEVDSIHRIPVDEFLRPDAPIVNDEYGARDDAEHRRATLSEPSASTKTPSCACRLAILGSPRQQQLFSTSLRKCASRGTHCALRTLTSQSSRGRRVLRCFLKSRLEC